MSIFGKQMKFKNKQAFNHTHSMSHVRRLSDSNRYESIFAGTSPADFRRN